jgi:hypothetical protein
LLVRRVEAVESLSATRLGRPSVVHRDGRAKPAGPGVDEQPQPARGVAIELEEMVAPAQRPEVAAR